MAGDGESRVDDAGAEDDESVDAFLRRVAHVSARPLGLIAAFAPTLVSPPPPGVEVGHEQLPIVARESYNLIAEYGRGGMGRILVARDNRLGRRVAIKELLTSDGHAVERFVREVRITARLQHPSIVPVHEAGRWPTGEPFYAMKLVSGRPLSIVIDETRSADGRLALVPVLIAVAEAIAYAHNQKVIHRDLKPDNILVGDFGETVVIDWGLAKRLDDVDSSTRLDSDETRTVTLAGTVVGTPGFMSPEQAAGKDADERSDVYALGAILYTLLAGRPPYAGQDAKTVVAQTLAGPPQALRIRQREVPVDLLAIVDKAMARDPGARYASAKELAADLNRFTTGQLVSAHHYSRPHRVVRFVRRHRLPVAVAAVALVLLSATAVASFRAVVRQRDLARQAAATALAEKAAAEKARAAESETVDRLVLSQARAALDGDPTLALAWLKRLRPAASGWREEARVVAARAQARFVASAIRPGRVAALSSDGGLLATAAADGTVRLFSGGDDGVKLDGNVGRPAAIALSPDGARLAAGGSDGARLYDLGTRRALPLDAMGDDVATLAVAGDGSTFAFAGSHGVRVVDRQGRALPAPEARGAVTQLVFAGAQLLVRDGDGVLVWDGRRARRIAVAGPGPIAVSHDGARLAVGGRDGVRVLTLGLGDGRLVSRLATDTLAFAPDGDTLALCAADGSLLTLGLGDGKINNYSHSGEPCRDLVFDDGGGLLASTRGPMVRAWSLPAGTLHKLRGHDNDVRQLAVSHDGRWLASSALDDTVRVWPLEARPSRPLPLPSGAQLALAGDGTRLAAAAPDGQLTLHELDGADELVAALPAPARALAWGGARLAVAAGEQIRVFEARPAALPITIDREAERVALSADGNWLASQRPRGTLELQALAPSRPPRLLAPPLPPVAALALAPDGSALAAAAPGARVVHVWSATAQHRELELDHDATSLAFVDGELLAVAETAGGLELIHLPSGERWSLAAPRARVLALASSGAALRALCDDGRVRSWPPLPPSDATALRAWIDKTTRARLDAAGRLR